MRYGQRLAKRRGHCARTAEKPISVGAWKPDNDCGGDPERVNESEKCLPSRMPVVKVHIATEPRAIQKP